ncbi:MAG: hypothetical protein ISS16_03670 [Ignavibacteria bacterium]|nr:hypothetical protein [Bacteroidota bacterium]MBL7128064.1 hypothetical protein [Ignavibacteria bacterium]
MENNNSISNIKKYSPVLILVSIFSIFTGLMFFIMQTGKLFTPEEAEAEMLKLPMGLFDWGYVWSDTIIAGPSLFIGGMLLIWGNKALGHLLVFTGFAINLYAMIFLFIGFNVVGSPIVGFDLYLNVIWTLLGMLCMVYCARYIVIHTIQNN